MSAEDFEKVLDIFEDLEKKEQQLYFQKIELEKIYLQTFIKPALKNLINKFGKRRGKANIALSIYNNDFGEGSYDHAYIDNWDVVHFYHNPRVPSLASHEEISKGSYKNEMNLDSFFDEYIVTLDAAQKVLSALKTNESMVRKVELKLL